MQLKIHSPGKIWGQTPPPEVASPPVVKCGRVAQNDSSWGGVPQDGCQKAKPIV